MRCRNNEVVFEIHPGTIRLLSDKGHRMIQKRFAGKFLSSLAKIVQDDPDCSEELRLAQTRNVCRSNKIKHCLVTRHFTIWTPFLIVLDRV